jgi:hypothetical protein
VAIPGASLALVLSRPGTAADQRWGLTSHRVTRHRSPGRQSFIGGSHVSVDLQFGTSQRQTFVRGHVVRCSVVEIRSSGVLYRAAIAFEYPLPTRERVGAGSEGVSASRDAV